MSKQDTRPPPEINLHVNNIGSIETGYRLADNRDRLATIINSDEEHREALATLFRLEGFEATCDHSIARLETDLIRQPDIVVVGIGLLGENPGQIVRRLKARTRDMHIFVVAEEDGSVGDVVDVMRAGAARVVTQPVDKDALMSFVQQEIRKQSRVMLNDWSVRVDISGFRALTHRERQVLESIVGGNSNKETAMVLGISPRTVEVHRSAIMRKLGARNAAELIRIALTA